MTMNLAFCFIHAGYEYMSEREKREGASEKEKRNVGGGGTKWKTKRAMGKEKHDEIRV